MHPTRSSGRSRPAPTTLARRSKRSGPGRSSPCCGSTGSSPLPTGRRWRRGWSPTTAPGPRPKRAPSPSTCKGWGARPRTAGGALVGLSGDGASSQNVSHAILARLSSRPAPDRAGSALEAAHGQHRARQVASRWEARPRRFNSTPRTRHQGRPLPAGRWSIRTPCEPPRWRQRTSSGCAPAATRPRRGLPSRAGSTSGWRA